MPGTNPLFEERVLVLAPTGGDSVNAISILKQAGFHGEISRDILHLCNLAVEGAGTILIAEEALSGPLLACLLEMLKKQPSWSDIPLIVITSGGDTTQASLRAFNAFGPSGNITLVERPFRAITLVSTLQVALRSRRRQYEVRDLMGNLEKRVAERTSQLEETISELEAFSYSVSHDLRAPLRAMQGYSHILLEEHAQELSGDGPEYLKRIVNAATRLDRLVQDILTYSRFARDDLDISAIDVEKLIHEIVLHYPALQSPHAKIKIEGPLLRVSGHEGSLIQCISNLLGNAVKFVAPDKIPHVKIWTEAISSETRVCFQDNGIGIEPGHQTRIFKMFERGPHNHAYDGTGIGLAIVHKAVERMGGKVGVE